VNTTENCTSCADPYAFMGGVCLYSCPTGYYSENNVCKACSSSCATCETSSSNCLTCVSGLYLEDSTSCVTTCKSTNTADADTMTCVVTTATSTVEDSS